jgi:hypothetical protein
MAACPSGMSVDDCNSIHNAATISPSDLYNFTFNAAPAAIPASLSDLPQGLQTAISGCTAASGCKAVTYDFTNLSNTPQTVTSLPYILNTNQTTEEDKVVVVPNEHPGDYLRYSTLPGYEFSPQAFLHHNMIQDGHVRVEYQNIPSSGNTLQKCYATCDAGSDCAGFNFDSLTGMCEFFPTGRATTAREDLNTDREDPYNRWTSEYDSGIRAVSYAKRQPPPLNKNDTIPSSIDISKTGRFCHDYLACNTAIDKMIDGGALKTLSTSELDDCSGCPVRQFRTDGSAYTVKYELQLSKTFSSAAAAKTAIHYGTGSGASHTFTPPFPANQNVTVRKVDGTTLFTMNSNVNGTSNVSITTAPWLDSNGQTRTIIFQSVDFVTNGFLIMDGKTYTFYSSDQNNFGRMTDRKYSPGYVSNVYVIT